MRLVARLEDSHAALLPGTAPLPHIDFPQFDPGFACIIDDRDRPIVYTIDQDSPAEKAGVKPGMAVVSVNRKPAGDALAACMRHYSTYHGYSSDRVLRYDAARAFVRQMRRGADVHVVMEDPDGKEHAFDLKATLGSRYLPRLPVPIDGIADSADVSWKRLDDGIGYIYVRRIRANLIESLDSAIRELADVKGLAIDVRGNTGGGFDAQRALRNFDLNDGNEPHRPRYAGPIALLIDEHTISAGEGWASWFIANKRATVFGTATAGASSRKAQYTLTNGLYKVTVPVKAYTGFLDRPIERRGLEPDVPIRANANDIAQGRDTVLEAAREHLLKVR
jgi:C-terminal processing protease CtpA/Prc